MINCSVWIILIPWCAERVTVTQNRNCIWWNALFPNFLAPNKSWWSWKDQKLRSPFRGEKKMTENCIPLFPSYVISNPKLHMHTFPSSHLCCQNVYPPSFCTVELIHLPPYLREGRLTSNTYWLALISRCFDALTRRAEVNDKSLFSSRCLAFFFLSLEWAQTASHFFFCNSMRFSG